MYHTWNEIDKNIMKKSIFSMQKGLLEKKGGTKFLAI